MWRPIGHLIALGPINGDRMSEITRALVVSFLDEHVRDLAAGTFTATASRYEEVR
jgi:hypothetical protein